VVVVKDTEKIAYKIYAEREMMERVKIRRYKVALRKWDYQISQKFLFIYLVYLRKLHSSEVRNLLKSYFWFVL